MAKKKKVVEHRVILYVKKKDCDDNRTMSEKQMKNWIERHFIGCDYGEVRVADVMNEERDEHSSIFTNGGRDAQTRSSEAP